MSSCYEAQAQTQRRMDKPDEASEEVLQESTRYLNLSRRYYDSGRSYVMRSVKICTTPPPPRQILFG